MDLVNLSERVRNAAKAAAKHSREIGIEEIRERLFHMDIESVAERIRAKRLLGCSGAIPSGEPITTRKTSSRQPARVIGVGSSQIYPSPDHPVRWAYIQAVIYPWTGQQPIGGQFIDIGDIERHQLIKGEPDRLNSTAYIKAWRSLLELEVADNGIQKCPEAVLLLDNPLLPFGSLLLDAYTNFLGKMKGAMVAGYISSPRSHMIYQLLRLAYTDTIISASSSIFDDTQIMRTLLEVGQRSAVFLHGNWRNIDFERAGAEIYFFFLKINKYEIARVEIPEWIAYSPDALDLIHSSILSDCHEHHYPNVLQMAHKMAKVPRKVGRQLKELALRTYQNNGGDYYPSAEKQAKGY